MKVNELKIGNTIKNGVISGIKFTNSWYIETNEKWIELEYIEPIPLTEEWLLKFGFVYNDTWGRYFKGHEELRKEINGFCYFLNGSWLFVDYVHKLQNLYFALTNEEL